MKKWKVETITVRAPWNRECPMAPVELCINEHAKEGWTLHSRAEHVMGLFHRKLVITLWFNKEL